MSEDYAGLIEQLGDWVKGFPHSAPLRVIMDEAAIALTTLTKSESHTRAVLKTMERDLRSRLEAAEAKVDALMREKEELLVDAERYRCLRKTADATISIKNSDPVFGSIWIHAMFGERLDKAVDIIRAIVREQNTSKEDTLTIPPFLRRGTD